MTIDGIPIRLTEQQSQVFALLWNARGRPVTTTAALEAMYSAFNQPDNARQVVRVIVYRLRKLLAGTRFEIQRAGYGCGYRMVRSAN